MTRSPRTLALLFLLAATTASTARAQTCSPLIPLTAGTPVTATTDPARYSYAPASAHWSVEAVRANDNAVWDISAYDTTAGAPSCFGGPVLDSGDIGGVAFLVTDWRWRGVQTDDARVASNSGTGTSAAVNFDVAVNGLRANFPFETQPMSAGTPARIYETDMFATIDYRIRVIPAQAMQHMGLYVFEPVAFGNGYMKRSEAVVHQTLNPGLENDIDFVCPFDGTYAIVLVNEDGVDGGYSIAVAHCPFSFSSMADNAPQFTVSNDNYTAINPTSPTWGVVGDRGEGGSTFGIDVAPNLDSQYGPLYTCTDSVLAAQDTGAGVRLIAGDFRALAKRFYTVHLGYDQEPGNAPLGNLEWEDGADLLTVNAAPTAVTPPTNNVLDAWSVNLAAGEPYQVHVDPAPGATADYRVLLFRNPSPGTPYWATRAGAVADAPHLVSYTAPATGLYGVVVVNDNGGTGDYAISVTGPGVGVPPGATAAVSRIVAVQPNPTFAGARVAFTLGAAGHASLVLHDLLGRTLATVGPPDNASGAGELAWDGRTDSGARVPPGVYFVTLLVDGRAVDEARVVVLR